MKCEQKHDKYHKIINYKNILPDEEEIKKELKEFKNKIDKFKNVIKEKIIIYQIMFMKIYKNIIKFFMILFIFII